MSGKKVILLGIVAALVIHAGILFFGGLLFFKAPEKKQNRVEVELMADETKKPDDPKEEEKPKVEEKLEAAPDQIPDARELVQQLEQQAAAPKLEALSLADLEGALGGAGGGDFGSFKNMAGGGIIGGTGAPGGVPGGDAFGLGDLDSKPRVVFQVKPTYPQELFRKDVAGKVVLRFVVDADGRVVNPRVEQSTDPAFEKPALEAVRQWKYEPGIRDGKKVAVKMRAPISFARQ